jgi:hypothetical protein
MEGRLRALLVDFRWGRMDDIFLGALSLQAATNARSAV